MHWDFPSMNPTIREKSASWQVALNYETMVNSETRHRVMELEGQARLVCHRIIIEEVDEEFNWIPDPRLMSARENLFSRAIELK